ncbi:hypothetical protein RRG08_027447 [Elysia crispata]|uniref:Uncharacterized protein n=1 Tax=Elysia crispata TaxID=231223 RepID=A0AAE0YRD8_9GAST|nr:hypothetical protein RRG08_027447 [Elysia crispata]
MGGNVGCRQADDQVVSPTLLLLVKRFALTVKNIVCDALAQPDRCDLNRRHLDIEVQIFIAVPQTYELSELIRHDLTLVKYSTVKLYGHCLYHCSENKLIILG